MNEQCNSFTKFVHGDFPRRTQLEIFAWKAFSSPSMNLVMWLVSQHPYAHLLLKLSYMLNGPMALLSTFPSLKRACRVSRIFPLVTPSASFTLNRRYHAESSGAPNPVPKDKGPIAKDSPVLLYQVNQENNNSFFCF